MEDACGVDDAGAAPRLRRLLYCGEWIESHALHVFMLHAPDFLGYESAIAMAADHRDVVERGLRMKKAGNGIMRVVGGREIHPINVRVGRLLPGAARAASWPRWPSELEAARELALRGGRLDRRRWTSPSSSADYELVALRSPDEYPIERGRLVSTGGLDIAPAEYDEHFEEEQVPHSNALHSRMRDGGSYLVGPLARYGLNADRLSPVAREAAADAGLRTVSATRSGASSFAPSRSSTRSTRRCGSSRRYEQPDTPAVDVEPRAGTGYGWTEAPRGNALPPLHAGRRAARSSTRKIVPPTSQNQRAIEEDLLGVVQRQRRLDRRGAAAASASRRSATTTPASPARRIS